MTSLVIVGAGFSGTLLTLHLLRRVPPGTRIHLIERGGQFGRGQAYATGNPHHLLNVPAGRMSAFHEQPAHFSDWLRDHDTLCPGATPHCFVPRRVFGAYVRHLLKEELRRPGHPGELRLWRGEALALEREAGGLLLHLDRGRRLRADLAVLATGNFPPRGPPGMDPSLHGTALYQPDAWAPNALDGLPRDAAVLLHGTGLTTVDVVVSLLDRGHVGPIHALSRRGLLPRPHADSHGGAAAAGDYPASPLPLLRMLRDQVRQAEAAGKPWQSVFDGIRPFVQDIWLAMPPAGRRAFLRHLRPWWDVHRHRMAPQVRSRIAAAQRSGQLRVEAGRLLRLEQRDGGVAVTYGPRGRMEPARLRVARVINCAGAGTEYEHIRAPLIRDLLRTGLVRPDALRLGLDVAGSGALLSHDGAVSDRLFAVGPATRGIFWEITAVPDIRRQCEALAEHLAARVAAGANIPTARP